MRHDDARPSGPAVLFDLDGTLLDTLRDLGESMNAALEARGHPPHPLAAYRHLVGEGVMVLARRALPPGARHADEVEATVDGMLATYAGRWSRHTRPYPGVAALLDGLAHREIPFAVLSNKPDAFTRQTVDALLGRWTFAEVRGVRDGVPRKPDPGDALAIAAALGTPPADCLFCGDTRIDMETARAAGMTAVGALWGFRDREELVASGARHVIARPEELLDLVPPLV